VSRTSDTDAARCPGCGAMVSLTDGKLREHGSVVSGPCSGKLPPFSNHRNETERQIIVLLVEDLLRAGYKLGVNDGEEVVLESCADPERIFAVMSTTDEDYLLTEREEDERTGWVRLIYGNGCDVISDYTVNIPDSVFERANALSERFSSGGAS